MTDDESNDARRHAGREVYPHVEDEIGEDPARFLDREIFVRPAIKRQRRDGRHVPDVNVSDPAEFIAARISGIDRLEVVDAWLDVERKLIRTPDDGREKIVELLRARRERIETHGDRDDQLASRRERPEPVDDDSEDAEPDVYRHVECGTIVEIVSAHAFDCPECDVRGSTKGDQIEPAEKGVAA